MDFALFSPRYLIIAVFILTGAYVQLRGRVRHKLSRALADHSTLLAPYNTLMYAFSSVAAKPYADVERFPELAPIGAS